MPFRLVKSILMQGISALLVMKAGLEENKELFKTVKSLMK